MFKAPRFPVPSRRASRGGFTLVELLVVIGIIAILAGVALGPITNGINKAKQSTGMQSARSIALICFQYSIDNENYPCGDANVGFSTTGMAKLLLQGKYVSDPNQFYAGGQGKIKYAGTGGDFGDLAAKNISWDSYYITGATPTGVNSSTSDLLPLIFSTGNADPVPTANTAVNLTLTPANTFGNQGIAVCYKSNSAKFINATLLGTTATAKNFIDVSYNDQSVYTPLEP